MSLRDGPQYRLWTVHCCAFTSLACTTRFVSSETSSVPAEWPTVQATDRSLLCVVCVRLHLYCLRGWGGKFQATLLNGWGPPAPERGEDWAGREKRESERRCDPETPTSGAHTVVAGEAQLVLCLFRIRLPFSCLHNEIRVTRD